MTKTEGNILLKAVDLKKVQKYNVAVDHLNLLVPPHSNTAIIGETGSGKTTLLKLLAGLEQPDNGSIYYKGERLIGPNECLIPGHPEIAFLSQHFELFNNYYVHEFLSYRNEYSDEEALDLFRLCKIDHLLKRKTNELSGGERQRIALAKQLISKPSVLLLDEPFSNLDNINKLIIKSILQEVKQKYSITFVMVSHDALEVLSWADTIHILEKGRIVQSGNPGMLYRQPVSLYCAGLLGEFDLIENFDQYSLWSHLSNSNTKDKKLFIRPDYLQVDKLSKLQDGFLVKNVTFYGNYSLISFQFFDLELRAVSINSNIAVGDFVQITYQSQEHWYL